MRLVARLPASSKFNCSNPHINGKSLERSGFSPIHTSSVVFKSTATTEALGGNSQTLGKTGGQRRDVLDASFDDAHAAYKSKTTREILRAYIVYTLCSSSYLVENNMKVSKLN